MTFVKNIAAGLISMALLLPATQAACSEAFSVLRAAFTPPPPDTFVFQKTFCASQTLIIGNQIFDPSHPSGTVILPGAGVGGKDSIILVQLTFNQPVTNNLTASFCEGDTIYINGRAYHAGFFIGQETIANGAKNGCDSIIYVNLTFAKRGVRAYQGTICEGDTFRLHGQVYDMFRPSGETLLPNASANGCDSLIKVQLTVISPPFRYLYDTLCPDAFLMINGTRYDRNRRTGLEILDNASATGCDSLVNVQLSFTQPFLYLGEDTTVTQGQSVCIKPFFGFVPTQLVWSPAEPPKDSCLLPLATVTYKLTATDLDGCVLYDELRIFVRKENLVYAPNVFNPDAAYPDNRFFLSAPATIPKIRRLSIANRWGELVYDVQNIFPDDASVGWDGFYRGQISHVDTYIFWAELEKFDGTVFVESGSFTLVR